MHYTSVANEVRATFPGQFNVSLQDAAQYIGYAYKTARNLGDAFPLKSIKQGRLRVVPIVEIVRYLSAQLAASGIVDAVELPAPAAGSLVQVESAKRGRGRPRKIQGGA